VRKTKLDRGRERMSVTVVLRVVGILRVLLFAMFMAQPSFAQKLYAYEPPMIDPHATIYVNDGSCSSGKVLKVQGALRNQRRKKSCVPMSDLQAAPRSGAAK
jgi:hypothetical protein